MEKKQVDDLWNESLGKARKNHGDSPVFSQAYGIWPELLETAHCFFNVKIQETLTKQVLDSNRILSEINEKLQKRMLWANRLLALFTLIIAIATALQLFFK